METAGCGEDCEFGDDLGEGHGSAGAFEVFGFLEVVFDLFDNQGNVGFERFNCETEFHKLDTD